MAEVEINDLATIGVIQDEPGYQIPPEGWTLGQNVRYIANGVEQLPGWTGALGSNPRQVVTPPTIPQISNNAGGTLAAQNYFFVFTYVDAFGESLPSPENGPFNFLANHLFTALSPAANGNATGWNCYASNTTGTETKQNASPIPIGTNFVEPNTGLIVGSAPPGTNTTSDTPMAIMYVSSVAQPWWLWASLQRIYAFDGVNDNDITRQTAGVDVPYNSVDAKSWTNTIFQGVPIFNNGVDNPQFWQTYNPATKMQNLTAWPANFASKVVRSFLSYMFALNNTASGVNLPHNVRWSNAAVPGSLPTTWDFTDPTNDAGSTDLADVQSGRILDGQELQGQFFIYKETSTWRVQFIGSPFVFSFHSFLEQAGILATRCLSMTADGLRHCIATQDDIIIHNGVSTESLLSKRMRRYLFNRIDPVAYDTSFMFTNPVYDEIWFCYPSTGMSEPDSALIWNYKYNTFSEAFGLDFRATDIGIVPQSSSRTWAQATFPWSSDTSQWATSKRRRIIIANPNTRKLLLLDDTSTMLRDGLPFTATVQRTGLAVTGQKRNGQWIADFKNQKMIQVLWPKVQAPSPGIQIRVGYSQLINGSVTWNPYQQFDPNVGTFVEGCEGQGRGIGVEFRSQNGFRLDGYKLDIVPLGEF